MKQNLVIKDENGQFWSRESGVWHPIGESTINHGIWTREPSEEVKAVVRKAHADAFDTDRQAWLAKNPGASVMDEMGSMLTMATPHADAVRKSPDYIAMSAYEDYRLCSLESVGQ